MEPPPPPKSHPQQLFEVYLRLRPPPAPISALNNATLSSSSTDRFLTVETPNATPTPGSPSWSSSSSPSSSPVQSRDNTHETSQSEALAPPTHITINPPNDARHPNRRRAIEKFAFTRVFEEDAQQLDVFGGANVVGLVEGVLGGNNSRNGDGRDGLLATLGVTGSGKSHTILGSKSQRGLTQLALEVLYRSIDDSSTILDPTSNASLHATLAASDPSEAQVMSAQMFIDAMYGDGQNGASRATSRATTPMVVRSNSFTVNMPGDFPRSPTASSESQRTSMYLDSPKNIRIVNTYQDSILSTRESQVSVSSTSRLAKCNDGYSSFIPAYMRSTFANLGKNSAKSPLKGELYQPPPTPRKHLLQRPSALPQQPDISNISVQADPSAEYAILISMYEVYNDRIFDLLSPAYHSKSVKEARRRPLLFKSTEGSPDRKVVAGLRKIICGTMKEALMVLEAGLHERRVAGTGSNSVSSRSHGFFCVEVKKRRRARQGPWGGSALTIVDLAGSERARDAKTQGATLAEAGKINESLMYLGQCLQMQSDIGNSAKPNLVPFRQCKLTELLFSNSFPSASASAASSGSRRAQKAIMIVTADPVGDFNATSQILRYSALAREITVPRIPSVTSTILAGARNEYFSRSTGRTTPEMGRETMEMAALEIARLSEEVEGLRGELVAEQQRRLEAEAHLESMADRLMEVEAEVREECYQEMERQMQAEMQRWKASWAAEAERNEAHLDRKLDLLQRMGEAEDVDSDLDEADKENSHPGGRRELEDENGQLRREIELLRRECNARSPTKSKTTTTAHPSKRLPLRESRSRSTTPARGSSEMATALGLKGRRTSRSGSPHVGRGAGTMTATGTTPGVKKARQLTARRWEMGDDDGDEGFWM